MMRFTRRVICTLSALVAGYVCFAADPVLNLHDPLSNPGFVHFYNNEFDEAIIQFEKGVKAHPDDPESYNHLAQGILYREMLRDGALESQLVGGTNPFLRRSKLAVSAQDKQRFTSCVTQSVNLSQTLLEKNPQDVHALYALGVAHAPHQDVPVPGRASPRARRREPTPPSARQPDAALPS